MLFPVSGVEVNPLIPPLIALVVSTFTSMGGVSGAFLLLPFQVSILNFTSPAVSSHQPGLQHRGHPQRGLPLHPGGPDELAGDLGDHPGDAPRPLGRGPHPDQLAARPEKFQALRGLRAPLYRPAPAL